MRCPPARWSRAGCRGCISSARCWMSPAGWAATTSSGPGHPGTLPAAWPDRKSVLLGRRLAALLADQRFLARVADRELHAVQIGRGFVKREFARELAVGPQLALLVQRPHFLGVM